MKKLLFTLTIVFSFFIIGKANALDHNYSDVNFDKHIELADKFIKDYSNELEYYAIFFNPNGYLEFVIVKEEFHFYINNYKKIVLKTSNSSTSQIGNYQTFYINNSYEKNKEIFMRSFYYNNKLFYNASSINFGFNNNWYLYYSNYDLKYLGSDTSEDYVLNGASLTPGKSLQTYQAYYQYKWLYDSVNKIDVVYYLTFVIAILLTTLVLVIIIRKCYYFFISRFRKV